MTKRKNRQKKLNKCGRGEERTIANDQTEEQSEEIAQMRERRGEKRIIAYDQTEEQTEEIAEM